MAETPNATAKAVELKSGSITLPILKILSCDLNEISSDLDSKIGKAPEFFRHAPIIIDLGELAPGSRKSLDFPALLRNLFDYELSPVGVRGANADQQKLALVERVAILADVQTESPPIRQNRPKKTIPAPKSAMVATKRVDQPVRSGQRIYAAGGDLIVTAQVSPGAEIMADGNIHVYGSLKGRALAGVQGNPDARIFCSDLQAQLVAIGGHYRTSEEITDTTAGQLVQIYLDNETLKIDRI